MGEKLLKHLEEVIDRVSQAEKSGKKKISITPRKIRIAIHEAAQPKRFVLPNRRRSETLKLSIGGSTLFITLSTRESGELAEIFLVSKKWGSAFRAMLEAYAMLFSISLQYGVPLEELVKAFRGTRFEPSGTVYGHESIKSATSILDLVAQVLEDEYLKK